MFYIFMRKRFFKFFLFFPLVFGTVSCTGYKSKVGNTVGAVLRGVCNLEGGYKYAFWGATVTVVGGTVYQGYRYYQGYKSRSVDRRLREIHEEYLRNKEAEFRDSYRGQFQERYFSEPKPVKLTRWETVKVYGNGVYLGVKRNIGLVFGLAVGSGVAYYGGYALKGRFWDPKIVTQVARGAVDNASKVAPEVVKLAGSTK